jgi:hypothetical protein
MKKFDFESVKGRIVQNLQSKTSTANILPFGTNSRIIDVMSEAVAELARFDTYLTRENKWSLAQNKSSLVLQADILNYKPKRKISTEGEVRFSLHEELTNLATVRTWDFDRFIAQDTLVAYEGKIYKALDDISYYTDPVTNADKNPEDTTTDWERVIYGGDENVVIPAFSIFEGGGLQFCNITASVLVTTDDYLDLDVVQGVLVTKTNQASGDEYEEFFIEDDSIAEDYYWVTVNDVAYSEVGDLRFAEAEDFVFETKNDLNGNGVTFIFGNGIFGKKLIFGDVVEIKYIQTEGSLGNVTSSGIVIEVVSDLEFETLGSATVYVTNETSLIGGTEEEEIEDIRANAPKVFQTGGRATSAQDYVAILEYNFDFIGKAVVWGAFEENIDNNRDPGTFIAVNENRVWVAAFNTEGEALTTEQEELIQLGLNDLKAPTDLVSFEDVEIVGFIFDIDAVIIDRSYPMKQVETTLEEALEEKYSIFNMDFAENLYYSDFIAFVDSIDGVAYHNSSVSFTETRALSSAYATPTFFLAQDNIVVASVSIYVKDMEDSEADWIYVGYGQALGEDGGILIGDGDYSLADSTYEPTVGRVRVIVSGGVFDLAPPYANYRVKVEYQTTNLNYELSKRNQIYSLEEANISIRYRTNFENI